MKKFDKKKLTHKGIEPDVYRLQGESFATRPFVLVVFHVFKFNKL